MKKVLLVGVVLGLVLTLGFGTVAEAKKPVPAPPPPVTVTSEPEPIPDAYTTSKTTVIKRDTLDLNSDGVVDYLIVVKRGVLSGVVWTSVDYYLPEFPGVSDGYEIYRNSVLIEDTFPAYTYTDFSF